MKVSIYTVINDAYFKFGQIFIRSLYDKVNIDKINKIYISDTGLTQQQLDYLKSYSLFHSGKPVINSFFDFCFIV